MRAWLESIAGPEYASALIWTLGALILLLVILVIVRIVRGLTFGTFVAGGRNRKTRLAVMDATAVDSHRRLVLVRRDDVEHLILIGGPSDVVVEQNIRLQTPARRLEPRTHAEDAPVRQSHESLKPPPQAAEAPSGPATPRQPETTRPKPAESPATMTSRIASALRPAAATAPSAAADRQAASMSAAPAPKEAMNPAAGAHSSAAAPGKGGALDDALLKELEVTLNEKSPGKPAEPPAAPGEVEDEMSRLLGDLSGQRNK